CAAPSPPEPPPLSLHDALPISGADARAGARGRAGAADGGVTLARRPVPPYIPALIVHPSRAEGRPCDARFASQVSRPCWRRPRRSEEHTSELQSRENLVCRLLL